MLALGLFSVVWFFKIMAFRVSASLIAAVEVETVSLLGVWGAMRGAPVPPLSVFTASVCEEETPQRVRTARRSSIRRHSSWYGYASLKANTHVLFVNSSRAAT